MPLVRRGCPSRAAHQYIVSGQTSGLRRWIELLRKHDPQALPKAPAPTPSANVVPFNQPRH